tara:strand:- start:1434 stop:1634 length:201 start_codon:yes stop_codon:yes gene_type:complete
LYNRIGWDKKISEITEEEIKATILIMQFSKKVEQDEQYTKEQLDKLLLKYVHGKTEEELADDKPPF